MPILKMFWIRWRKMELKGKTESQKYCNWRIQNLELSYGTNCPAERFMVVWKTKRIVSSLTFNFCSERICENSDSSLTSWNSQATCSLLESEYLSAVRSGRRDAWTSLDSLFQNDDHFKCSITGTCWVGFIISKAKISCFIEWKVNFCLSN